MREVKGVNISGIGDKPKANVITPPKLVLLSAKTNVLGGGWNCLESTGV